MSAISYKVRGKGPAVLLLHGFPMNHQVWSEFAEKLAADFTVYTPDLPGFGESAVPDGSFSIEDVARSMLNWMSENQLANAVILGHSMGGYVALSMISQRPEWFRGLILFHSTAYPDGDEKKASRTKVIKFIDDNGVLAFTSNFIHPLYADQQHASIPGVRSITMQAGADTVKGYLRAMRDRPDATPVLKQFKKPVLVLAGDKDPGIPLATLTDQSRIGEHIQLAILTETGHMGMFEKSDESLTIVKTFIMNL
ncbi:MAG TPA: alpha/beta hydrolase [Ohtaekwangia sp.]|nr:alpha/beta hydrolase [Ohtaekwangia sp.]